MLRCVRRTAVRFAKSGCAIFRTGMGVIAVMLFECPVNVSTGSRMLNEADPAWRSTDTRTHGHKRTRDEIRGGCVPTKGHGCGCTRQRWQAVRKVANLFRVNLQSYVPHWADAPCRKRTQ